MVDLLNPNFKVDPDNESDEEEYEKPGFGDKIADGVCSSVETVMDILCAFFEWMIDRVMGL
ncbi:MAG: hypothetical protein LBB80_00380 [Treponema sp.]|jgi:hypothetical protein|nr:hypothetical protein [Treponema sp.]